MRNLKTGFYAVKRVLFTTVAASILTVALSVTAFATEYIGIGTVTGSTVNIRSAATTDAGILSTAKNGTKLKVLDQKNGWYQVQFSGGSGWMIGDYLSVAAITKENNPGTVTGSVVNIRAGAGTNYSIIGQVSAGTILAVTGQENSWYRVSFNGNTGWVHSDYFKEGKQTVYSSAASGAGMAVVNEATKHLGKPYVYGGNGPSSFDCSGFTKYVYAQLGYSLNRTAASQAQNGVAVDKDHLQPGDLLMFYDSGYSGIGHVAIYIGDGQMVHAGNYSTGVIISDVDGAYYGSRFVCARRIIS